MKCTTEVQILQGLLKCCWFLRLDQSPQTTRLPSPCLPPVHSVCYVSHSSATFMQSLLSPRQRSLWSHVEASFILSDHSCGRRASLSPCRWDTSLHACARYRHCAVSSHSRYKFIHKPTLLEETQLDERQDSWRRRCGSLWTLIHHELPLAAPSVKGRFLSHQKLSTWTAERVQWALH